MINENIILIWLAEHEWLMKSALFYVLLVKREDTPYKSKTKMVDKAKKIEWFWCRLHI